MKKLLSLALAMTLVLSLTTTVNAAASEETETGSDTSVTETERNRGRFDGNSTEKSKYHDFHNELPEDFQSRKTGNRPDLSEILADYPDELAEIQAIFDAMAAGDISRQEALEAMSTYADLLPEITKHPSFGDKISERPNFNGVLSGH